METLRKIGLVGLGILLFVSLSAANAAVALDRTALDSEFAKENAEEAGLYEAFAEGLRDGIGGGDPPAETEWPLERSQGELLTAAITDEYVRSQGEENVDAVYAYLHGETDELRLELETAPIKERAIDEIEADVETLELDAIMPSAEEIDGIPDGAGVESMAESRAAFEDARAEFRAHRKAEIQAETERELSDEELEERLAASMDDIREEMMDELDARLEGEFDGSEAGLEAPVRALQTARIDALTGEVTHEEYAETVETERVAFEDAFVAAFEAELEEAFPETIDVTEGIGEEETEELETAQTAVSTLSALALVLPAFALVIAGGIGYLAPRSVAAIEIGAGSLAAGLVGLAGSIVASGRIRTAFDTAEAPPGMGEFTVSFLTGILGAVTVQSAVLAGIGLVAIGVGVAIHLEYL